MESVAAGRRFRCRVAVLPTAPPVREENSRACTNRRRAGRALACSSLRHEAAGPPQAPKDGLARADPENLAAAPALGALAWLLRPELPITERGLCAFALGGECRNRAAASALIGNARWAQATPGWAEPPHLWIGVVGDSGSGKSPGADCLMRDVLPEIERRMRADFSDRLWRWQAELEIGRVAKERWLKAIRVAAKQGRPAPLPPFGLPPPEPQMPRLRQHDVTIEKVAALLAHAAPKGLLIVRDELVGWINGMNAHNSGGRAFWLEAYGGRPYRVERKASPHPIVIPHLAVAVYGGTQPDRPARLMREADDGLLARMLWVWPEPIPFRLGQHTPRVTWAIGALDRLREMELQPGNPPKAILVPLAFDARDLLEQFAREMQQYQPAAGPLLASALAKARGQALRLSLVLELLWWSTEEGFSPPPTRISYRAFASAATLMREYFVPMAARAYGDEKPTAWDQNAATLARWILRARPREVHVRHLQREVRLAGLRTAPEIHAAAEALIC